MPSAAQSDDVGLSHVVVAGGTPHEWLDMTSDQWRGRLDALAQGAGAGGAHWVTLLPHHGKNFDALESSKFAELLAETHKVTALDSHGATRFVRRMDSGLSVIVDPMADGHVRFAQAVEALRIDGTRPEDVDEELLSRSLLMPADTEVDLVVILGPPDRLPESMVWELAYSELVFLDLAWSELVANHLELAIDDFNRRHRRFGGLDS